MDLKAPRGTKDIYGKEVYMWQKLENVLREICENFCIEEIRTPIFEHTEVFQRSVGETTDIVQKEMYTFADKKARSLTLKPENTAGVARAYLENKLYADVQPKKMYYIAPCFRYERPQAGRMRQFHQFGIEVFGSFEASADAEVISLAYELLKRLNIGNVELHINSLGGPECRKKYNDVLKQYIGKTLDGLCPDCKERFTKNPLRVLDCKNDSCQALLAGAPAVLDCLDAECTAHFEMLKTILNEMDIPYVVDPKIVRGLDYYTRTVFEFVTTEIGAQGTVCGGGRYDGLLTEFGGNKTGAVGFGMGLERIMLLLEKQNTAEQRYKKIDVYVGSVGDNGLKKSQAVVYQLRKNGLNAEGDILSRSVKAQLKYADKIGANFSTIIGDNEIENDCIKLKNMFTGTEYQIKLTALMDTKEISQWEN